LGPAGATINVAVDGTYVYWNGLDGKSVMRWQVGAASPVTFFQASEYIDEIITDGDSVYWMQFPSGFQDRTLMKCSTSGCTTGAKKLAFGLPWTDFIVSDGVNVYWTDASANAVMKCSVNGCNQLPSVLISAFGPASIAVDATSVYWTTSDGSVQKA